MNKILPVEINKIKVYPFANQKALLNQVDKSKGILVAVNSEKILTSTEQTRNIINRNIGYADGVGAVWAMRKKKHQVAKIPGCELWLDILRLTYKHKSVYLVGGKPQVLDRVVAQLKTDFPGIKLVGHRDGYLKSDQEKDELIQSIANHQPDIVFVAMGSPKQELLMEEMQKLHPNAIYQGLGGSFDVYVGEVKRAPKFWVQLSLEWFYRWMKQPVKRTRRAMYVFEFFMKLYTGRVKIE